MQCAILRPPWVKYDTWAKDYTYLYREEGFEEVFEREWKGQKTRYAERTKGDAQARSSGMKRSADDDGARA
eukprot:4278150-Pyramimonas_sp.AAC.1